MSTTSTLDSLRDDLLQHDATRRLRAAETLATMGEEAAPLAVALAGAAHGEDDEFLEWVTAALESLGPPAEEAVPELASLLHDGRGDVGYWAATLLGRLGDRAGGAVPALAAVLAGDVPTATRQRAAWALGRIGPAAAGAREALRAARESDDARLARLAERALERLG